MARFGFCSGTYQSESVNADCQRSMNWYPEAIESGEGASAVALYPTPGLKPFLKPPKVIATATLKTLSSYTPGGATSGTNPGVNTFSTNLALGATGPWNLYNYFVQDSGTWVNRTDSVSWDVATNTWNNPVAITANVVYANISVTVASFYNWYALGAGVPQQNPPDVLHLNEVWIDVTYTDHSTGTLRPTTMNIVPNTDWRPNPGGTGTATLDNPANAKDADLTTYATFTRYWQGGDSGPVLQFTNFLDPLAPGVVGGNAVRGLYTFQGRTFAVGENLLELFVDGTSKNWGSLPVDPLPVTMAGHPNGVIIICAGGNLWAFDLVANTLTQVAVGMDTFNAVDYCDGYMVALASSSSTTVPVGTKFYISDPTDPTSWNPIDFSGISMYADSALAMLVDHREIWFWGPKRTVVYYDSGNPDFPFEPIPSAFIEQGIAAPSTPVRLDNSVFWIGADERGAAVAWRAQGYLPIRVSTHAVENAWTEYSRIDNAIAYSYQDKGHGYWVIYFPTPSVTWVYDTATGMWHERGFWDSANNQYTAHRSRCHVYSWGKHLVGDWAAGNIYQMSTDFLTDDIGDAAPHEIRRFRRAPHLTNEYEQGYFFRMQLAMETGIGPPILTASGIEREPQVCLRWSNDGGHTWSNEHWAGAGNAGEYRKRVIWRRLGKARDRIFEVSVSDPISWRLVDAHLTSTSHETPIPRYATQMAKMQ